MNSNKPDIIVDVTGEVCPIPLIEFRKAVTSAKKGEIVQIIGTHEDSKKEIPLAAEGMGLEVISIEEEGGLWKITIRKTK